MKKLQIYAVLICGSLITGCILGMDAAQKTELQELLNKVVAAAEKKKGLGKVIKKLKAEFGRKNGAKKALQVLHEYNALHSLNVDLPESIKKAEPLKIPKNPNPAKPRYKDFNDQPYTKMDELPANVVIHDLQSNHFILNGTVFTTQADALKALAAASIPKPVYNISTFVKSPLAKILVVVGAAYALYRYYVKTEVTPEIPDQDDTQLDGITDAPVTEQNYMTSFDKN